MDITRYDVAYQVATDWRTDDGRVIKNRSDLRRAIRVYSSYLSDNEMIQIERDLAVMLRNEEEG